MRWRETKVGETRRVVKFAFLPTLITDEKIWVWLERYVVIQKYYYSKFECEYYWLNSKMFSFSRVREELHAPFPEQGGAK
jgi:hypothetical protein